MRIGVDIRPLLDQPLTGVGEYTFHVLGALLREASHEDHFVLFASSRMHSFIAPQSWPTERFTLRQFHIPNKLLNVALFAAGKPRLERLVGTVDLLFVPNANFLPRSISVPVVTTAHDLSFLHYPQLFSLRRRMWHRVVRPENLFKRSAAVIAVSEATRRDVIRSLRIPEQRVTAIPSGIAVHERSAEEQQQAKQRYHMPEQFLFALGTQEPRKNLVTLLEVFALLKREHGYAGDLVIAGGAGWSRKALDQTLARHSYRSAIHVLGFVRQAEKEALYQMADLFLSLSLYEGFGFPPLEAAVLGTPVITGHHSSLSEIMGDTAVLVDVHNVRDIARAATTMLGDPSFRANMQRQRGMLKSRYSWDRAAQQTLQLFHSVVQRNNILST